MVSWLSRKRKMEPPVLDRAYLDRLANHIGERETRELMADGMIDLTERLDILHRLTERGSVDEIGRIAHEIAGAAGHLGLSALSIAAVDAARQAREAPMVPVVDLAMVMLDHRDAALDALSGYCSGGDD